MRRRIDPGRKPSERRGPRVAPPAPLSSTKSDGRLDKLSRLVSARAVHIAGQAVASVALGVPFRAISLEPTRHHDGRLIVGSFDRPDLDPAAVGSDALAAANWIVQYFAGRAALLTAASDSTRVEELDRSDLADPEVEDRFPAVVLATIGATPEISGPTTVREIQGQRLAEYMMLAAEGAADRAEDMVRSHAGAIRRVAELLVKRKTLSRADVVSAMRGRPPLMRTEPA